MTYAHNMPGFMTYREVALIYASLDDEAAGKVIKAVCDFFCFGTRDSSFEGRAQHIYETMISAIDKDQDSYNSRCLANAENGKKGGRPPKNKTQK